MSLQSAIVVRVTGAAAVLWLCSSLAPVASLAAAADFSKPCPAEDTAAHRALVEETCADVARWLVEIPGEVVRRARGPLVDDRLGCTRPACEVRLSGRFSALGERPDPVEELRERLRASGWRDTLVHDADGPNGTRFSLHKPGALCLVVGFWNHWDDEDGPHLDDPFEIAVSCGLATTRPPTLEDAGR